MSSLNTCGYLSMTTVLSNTLRLFTLDVCPRTVIFTVTEPSTSMSVPP